MKVGLLFEYPTVNGGENSMLAVARHLRETEARDVELHALAPAEGSLAERLDEAGIMRSSFDVFHDGVRRDRGELATKLTQLARQHNLDLLHANSLSMGRLLGAANGQLPCPTTAHLRDILTLSGAAARDLNRNARLIAVSEATCRFHIRQGLDSERVVTIHNSIDADRFVAAALPVGEADSPAVRASVRRSVRAEFRISQDAFVILSVGQIGLRKGLDVLSETSVLFAAEPSESATPIHVLLVGTRFSTKAESVEFERQVLRRFRDAEPHVVLHATGYREDVPRLMLAADLLVHAARQEPLGRVLLEAAAMGLPTIATDVGGTPEILEDRHSALLVPPGQPDEFCRAIVQMRNDSGLRMRLGIQAAETARSRFGIARAALLLIAEWQTVCGNDFEK